jgi:hypothetical protein
MSDEPPNADQLDLIDIGCDTWISFYQHSGHPELGRTGLIERHKRPDNGEWCQGSVLFDHVPEDLRGKRGDGSPRHVWHVESMDPLTLTPSILCRVCKHHGFIRDGRWVPA